MTEIKIPQITLPSIDIPPAPFFTRHKLGGQIPGCNLFHRDLEVTRNPSLLISDKNGTITSCPDGQIPSFDPIRFDPNEIIYTDNTPTFTNFQKQQTKTVLPKQKDKLKDQEPPPCPDLSRVLPVGSFTSDLRTARIKEYKRADNGYDCLPIIEEVTFVRSVLPSASTALNIVTISLLATAGPALLLPIIKSASKTAFKKILAKFDKKKDKESSS